MSQKKQILERNGRIELVRQRELLQFEREIRQREYILISSTPQCGLSTFLFQACEHLKDVQDLKDWEPIFGENPRWEGSLFVHLANQIAGKFLKNIKNQKSRIRRFHKIAEEKGLEALFDSAFGKNEKNVIFFLDNFHTLDLEAQKHFVSHIRQLHTYRAHSSCLGRILFVIGGTLHWQRIDPDRTSPFSNAASKMILGDLSQEDTILFLHHLFRSKGHNLPEMILEHIYEWTQGHPYFIQILSKILLSSEYGPIHFQQVDQAVHALVEQGDFHLREIRETLLGQSTEDLEPLFSLLRGGVVKRSSLVPSPKIENMLLLGILRIHPDNRLGIRNPIYSCFLRRDPILQEKIFASQKISPPEILCYSFLSANKEGYSLLNRMENQIRNFIVEVLYSQWQENWDFQGLSNIQTDPERDALQNKMVRDLYEVLELRKSREEQEFPISSIEDPLISYATIKELELILVKHWKFFKDFIGSQDRLKVYFTTLNRIRNKLAHNRRITDLEVHRLQEIDNSFKKWLGSEI